MTPNRNRTRKYAGDVSSTFERAGRSIKGYCAPGGVGGEEVGTDCERCRRPVQEVEGVEVGYDAVEDWGDQDQGGYRGWWRGGGRCHFYFYFIYIYITIYF